MDVNDLESLNILLVFVKFESDRSTVSKLFGKGVAVEFVCLSNMFLDTCRMI